MKTATRGRRIALAAGLALLAHAFLSSPALGLELQRVGDFRQPVYVTAPASEPQRLYVAERRGRIVTLGPGKRRRSFLRVAALVDLAHPENQFRDQGGLLSLAFAPDYDRSGLLYLLYTHRGGTIHLDEFSRKAGTRKASRASRRTVLTLPRRGRKDLGGHLAFGPDGLLYVSLGVSVDTGLAQDLGSLAGKILRIDPRAAGGSPYSVPPGNPFTAVAGARPEVIAYGLRNPWRISFDPLTANLLVADVGEERFEEVNLVSAAAPGANFGWPLFEGRRPFEGTSAAGLSFPALAISHRKGVCAIVGGYAVRNSRIPSLRGRYLYGDVCSGRIYSARLTATGIAADRREVPTVSYLVSFGRDARGRLYAVSLLGSVYRLTR